MNKAWISKGKQSNSCLDAQTMSIYEQTVFRTMVFSIVRTMLRTFFIQFTYISVFSYGDAPTLKHVMLLWGSFFKMSDKVLVIRKILKFVSEIWSHENIRSGQSKSGGIVLKWERAAFVETAWSLISPSLLYSQVLPEVGFGRLRNWRKSLVY